MSYIEQTGSKGSNEPIYAMQDLSRTQLQILHEGISLLKEKLVSAEDTERHKLLLEIEALRNSFKTLGYG